NPIANFEILNTSAEVVGSICPGEIVQLNDLSEISGDGCQDVTYQWGISALVPGTPAQHCAPATGSTWTDPSPYIEFIEPGVFEISVQVTAGNCPIGIYTDTIIVEGPPSVSIDVNGESSDQICLDSISDELPHTVDFSQTYTPLYSNDTASNGQSFNSPSNYIWEITGDEITSDDYAYVNGTTSSSALPEIDFYSFGDYTITTTVEGNCDVSDENIFIYSINEIPSITNPDSDFEQTICSGDFTELLEFTSSVENTTFTWSFSTADTYLSGYNNQTTNTGNLSTQNIFNNSNIPGEVIFQVTPSTIDCEGETKLVIITVNPEPIIDNISEVICTGAEISITPTEGTIPSGTTYSWDAPVSSPVNAIIGGNSATDVTVISESELVNSTNSPAVLTYIITPSTDDDCVGDSFTVSVTVNPLGQVTNPGDQEFCNDDNISINFTTNNSGGDTTYTWTNSNSAIGLLSNSGTGSIDVVATNVTNEPITSNVVVTPSFDGCEGTPQTFTITVNPTPQLNDPEDQVIFTAESTSAVILTSPLQDIEFSWTTNEPTGNLIGLSQSSGTSNQILSETLVNNTSGPLVLTYTITPILNGVDCESLIEEYTVTINPQVTMFAVDDEVVCNGDEVNLDFESSNSGGSTIFEWTNDTESIGLSGSGSGDLPAFTAINNGTSPIVATLTVTPTFENGGISNEGNLQTFTITVNPTAQVDEIQDQILCNGEDTAEVIFNIQNISEDLGGSVITWGVTPSQNTYNEFVSEVQAELDSGVIDIVACSDSFAALKNDGTVVTWGLTISNGIGVNKPENLSGVVKIYNTTDSFAALKADGSVVTWGDQFGADSSTVSSQISSGVVEIYKNAYAFAALKEDGSVVTWGVAATGYGGGDSSTVQNQLQSGIIDIASGDNWFAALKEDGSVITWGDLDSSFYDVQDQLSSDVISVHPKNNFPSGTEQQYESGNAFVAIKSDGSVVSWGSYTDCSSCINPNIEPTLSKLSSGVISIFTGPQSIAALKSDGSLVTWGLDYQGGDSSLVISDISSGVVDVVCGSSGMAALKEDGSVVIWGYAPNSTLDNAPTINSGAIKLFNTTHAFAALMNDGSLKVWGLPESGGDTGEIANDLLSGVLDMQFNGAAGAALKSNGSVKVWGSNNWGSNTSLVENDISSGVTEI
ncbi:hypothetical protein N9K27_04365, partial [Flavobacteriaceae bacterium]|nr:hypothetical protein [Flavobacteriaceae bacterium]